MNKTRGNFIQKAMLFIIAFNCFTQFLYAVDDSIQIIDRKAVVQRHNIVFAKPNPAEIPQVGNGEVAFGVDVTGLQTLYGNTLSQWGWHSSPLPEGKSVEDFKMTEVNRFSWLD